MNLIQDFQIIGQDSRGGALSKNNSTNSALAAGASFIGTADPCINFSSLIVSCKTDQAGSLYVDFSNDSQNWDSTIEFKVEANVNETHRVTVTRPFVRVRFTNTSASNQTYFRLATMFGEKMLLSSPLNQSVQQDADSIVAKIIDTEASIAVGLLGGYSIVNKYGTNSAVSTGTVPEDIWEGGGEYTGWATAAEKVEVFSSSVNDTSNGSGARTVRMIGLDANYNVIQETVTLNGNTGVLTTQDFLRVHTAAVLTSGNSNTAFNAGTITFRQAVTTANVFTIMQIGRNQTNSSGYTIPAGFTGYLIKITAVLRNNTTGTMDGALYIRAQNSAPRLRRPFSISTSFESIDEIYGGLVLPEKTDVIIRITYASTNSMVVAGGYDLILVQN